MPSVEFTTATAIFTGRGGRKCNAGAGRGSLRGGRRQDEGRKEPNRTGWEKWAVQEGQL